MGIFFPNFSVILELNTGPTYKLSISGFAQFPFSFQEGTGFSREWLIPSKGKGEEWRVIHLTISFHPLGEECKTWLI